MFVWRPHMWGHHDQNNTCENKQSDESWYHTTHAGVLWSSSAPPLHIQTDTWLWDMMMSLCGCVCVHVGYFVVCLVLGFLCWLCLCVCVLDLHLQLLNLFGGFLGCDLVLRAWWLGFPPPSPHSLVFVCVGWCKLRCCVALMSAFPVLDLHLQLPSLCCVCVRVCLLVDVHLICCVCPVLLSRTSTSSSSISVVCVCVDVRI